MKSVIAFILFTTTLMASQKSYVELKDSLEAYLREQQGVYAVVLIDMKNNASILMNEKDNYHAASTMKTPVMIEVFRQVEQGKFSLDDSVIVKNKFKSIVDGSDYSLSFTDDSDDELYRSIGGKETIRSLVMLMITVSSNLATNILIDIVGAENIMATLNSLGVHDMKVLRGVEDQKAYDAGLNNTTTAYDLAKVFEQIAKSTAASEQSCRAMIDILSAQKFNSMIPALLPPNVRVAHKTGSISNVLHDSGIIYLPDGRTYVLVILSKNIPSEKNGKEVISVISKKIFDFYMK